MLCEGNTGYICNFAIFSSQASRLIETIQTNVPPYTNVWCHLYVMDNYYNSVDNTQALLQKKLRYVKPSEKIDVEYSI